MEKTPNVYTQFVKYIIQEKKGSLSLAQQIWKGVSDSIKQNMKNMSSTEQLLQTFDTISVGQNKLICLDEELKLEVPLILSKEHYPVAAPPVKRGRKTNSLCKT
jgi:hypothetical protein